MKMSLRFTASGVSALIMGAACFGQHYTQTNLVSNESGVAPVTDPQLIDPWGLSRMSSSAWWISDNATGLSTLYNGAGAKQSLIVIIPTADPNNKNTPTGTPTGTIANGSQTDFLLAPGKPSLFLFSTIDGTIAGWNPTVAVGLTSSQNAGRITGHSLRSTPSKPKPRPEVPGLYGPSLVTDAQGKKCS